MVDTGVALTAMVGALVLVVYMVRKGIKESPVVDPDALERTRKECTMVLDELEVTINGACYASVSPHHLAIYRQFNRHSYCEKEIRSIMEKAKSLIFAIHDLREARFRGTQA